MIIFGRRKKEIQRGKITNVVCPSCSENTTMDYLIEIKYFHLYWIPFVPYKKNSFVTCLFCDEEFDKKHFSDNIKNKLKRQSELKTVKKPLWMYSGIILLIILTILAIYQSKNASSNREDYKANPKVGDVYFLNCLPSKYTTMKIVAVENDSIHFIENDTSVTRFKHTFSINRDNYYTNKVKTYSKSQIKNLFQNDSIYTINRE